MSLFWSLLDLEVVSVKFENIQLKPHSIKSTFILSYQLSLWEDFHHKFPISVLEEWMAESTLEKQSSFEPKRTGFVILHPNQ